jgi:hypothetical protein
MENEREADKDDGQDNEDQYFLFGRGLDNKGQSQEDQPDEHDFKDLVQQAEFGDDQDLENDAENKEIGGQETGLEQAMSEEAEFFHD